MRVDNSARSGGIINISLIFYNGWYVVCSHWNRLIEAILMSTHNIPFSIYMYKKENHTKFPISAAMGLFPGDSRTSSKQPW